MDITIGYSDIIDRCTMLSAFEGREAIGADGASQYEKVKITELDKVPIKLYIEQGAQIIESKISSLLDTEGEYRDTEVVFTLHQDAARRGTAGDKGFVKTVSESLVAYAMSRWLENKVPPSSQSYRSMFEELSDSAIKIIKTKRKPTRPE